jgi:hypothetical protein
VNVESVLPGVIINTIAGDDVINAAELAAGQTISGKVVNAEAGNTVTVTIGGNSYTATVQSDLTWSVNVPESVLTALGNGDLTVTASVTNGVGNSGSGEREITIDANLPGLRVDTVAGDDVINSIEHGQNLIITGSSDGLAAGTALTVTVNGKTYPATVLADGTWSAAIPAADVGALAAGTVTVTVAGQSSAGNPVSISHDVTVDLATVAISIDAIATDDVINAAEKGADLVLSGTTSNVEENQTVTITFGGKSYTATVAPTANGRPPCRCRSGGPERRRRQRAGERHQRERQQRLGGPRVQRGCDRAVRDHQYPGDRRYSERRRSEERSDRIRHHHRRSGPDGHRIAERQRLHHNRQRRRQLDAERSGGGSGWINRRQRDRDRIGQRQSG